MTAQSTKTYRQLSNGEEIVNAITHGIGSLLSIAALVVLIIVAQRHGDIWHLVSFSIYGSTLILLYLSSTLYHSFSSPRIKNQLVLHFWFWADLPILSELSFTCGENFLTRTESGICLFWPEVCFISSPSISAFNREK